MRNRQSGGRRSRRRPVGSRAAGLRQPRFFRSRRVRVAGLWMTFAAAGLVVVGSALSWSGFAPWRDHAVFAPVAPGQANGSDSSAISQPEPVRHVEREAAPIVPALEERTRTADPPQLVSGLRGKPRLMWREKPPWAPWASRGAPRATFWWSELSSSVRSLLLEPDEISNIRKADYAGPESCRACHEEKYTAWSRSPHRWMNAVASEATVRGDFSGGPSARIDYRGGRAVFQQENGHYWMHLVRGQVRRSYRIERTIGSRFQQYYTGILTEGPEPSDHAARGIEHVLPFGYWLDRGEWVPVVHVELEVPDAQRHDPYQDPPQYRYDRHCASCHTTQPAGDRMLRGVGRERLAAYAPHHVAIFARGYLEESHPELMEVFSRASGTVPEQIHAALSALDDLPARSAAASLGITCEGCHNGAKYHVEDETRLPRFFPSGRHVLVGEVDREAAWGRNRANLNWVCAQCHSGGRKSFAAGISVWNSTEVSDAMRGSCYDPTEANQRGMEHLSCVHCHDPHVATGRAWSHSEDSDDQRCVACHTQYQAADLRLAHTHHPDGSPGARCMNCHMPKINEGIQDVVRTHTIFSPINRRMLEANHPNACNLCHLEKPIDWTLAHLRDWYGLRGSDEVSVADGPGRGKVYSSRELSKNYPQRDRPIGIGWLTSPHQATRLVAAEALTKAGAKWALPELIAALDDPYLINRQFTAQGLERMLGIRLQDHGYRYYMFEDERREALERLKREL